MPEDEWKPLFTDLYDRTSKTLYEAKGSVERGSIRMAIGQLADYKRYVDDGAAKQLAVLLPSEPRPDLLRLLRAEGIEAVWPTSSGFTDTAGGNIVNP